MDFKKTKDSYVAPEFEVVAFVSSDIITTSDNNVSGGNAPGKGEIDSGAWDA